jgi:tetratricopeptide (TPR) repeat protein
MTKTIGSVILGLILGAAAVMAQAKQPQVKSAKERDAIIAVQNATTPQAKLAAIDNVLDNFADTEFKPMLLTMATAIYNQMGNFDQMVIYGERTLKVDPNNFQVLVMLATGYAQHTREFDLDKEEKLAKAEDYAKRAIAAVQTASKPRPDISDVEWDGVKKDITAECHAVFGMVASLRKKYDVAIQEYKTAIATAATPEPGNSVRLAAAYDDAGKPDEAIPVLDQVLATPNLNPVVKQVAESEKSRAAQIKAHPNAAKPASGEIPIKQ